MKTQQPSPSTDAAPVPPNAATPGNVTIKDVAAAAAVSTMTVSRALNAPHALAPATRARVLKAIAELGYIPNQAAAGLQSARSRIVGFLMPDVSVPFYHRMHVGLSHAVEPHGYTVLVAETRYQAEREAALARSLLGWRPSGVVRVRTDDSASIDRAFRQADVPCCEFVDVHHTLGELGVGFSLEEIGHAVGQGLLQRGRRRIGGVLPKALSRFRLQAAGIQRAVGAVAGSRFMLLEVDAPSPLTLKDGADAVTQCLAREPELDALVFFSDPAAAGALLECQRQHIAVPDRLAIVGFGDYEWAPQMIPPLTTVQVDAIDLGRQCGELLLKKIAEPALGRTIREVPFSVIWRGSA